MHAPATVELVVKTSPLPICPWDDMEEQIGALEIWSAPKIWRGANVVTYRSLKTVCD